MIFHFAAHCEAFGAIFCTLITTSGFPSLFLLRQQVSEITLRFPTRTGIPAFRSAVGSDNSTQQLVFMWRVSAGAPSGDSGYVSCVSRVLLRSSRESQWHKPRGNETRAVPADGANCSVLGTGPSHDLAVNRLSVSPTVV